MVCKLFLIYTHMIFFLYCLTWKHKKYCCGKQTLPNETLLMDHFSEKMCCPRYESKEYWEEKGMSYKYLCIEGVCYDEYNDCCVPSHKKGREEKNVVHRCSWLYTFLNNTPPLKRKLILDWLRNNERNNKVVRRVVHHF